jgi:hypothetical protein
VYVVLSSLFLETFDGILRLPRLAPRNVNFGSFCKQFLTNHLRRLHEVLLGNTYFTSNITNASIASSDEHNASSLVGNIFGCPLGHSQSGAIDVGTVESGKVGGGGEKYVG